METRKELVESPEYVTTVLQIQLFDMVRNYLDENNLTQSEFAKQLGVSKGYVSQILNCRSDSRLSSLVKLALACGKIPDIEFRPIEEAEAVDSRKQFGVHKERDIRIHYIPGIFDKPNFVTVKSYRADYNGFNNMYTEDNCRIAV